MPAIAVAIIGASETGASVYCALRQTEGLEIAGIFDEDPAAPGMILAKKENILVSNDMGKLIGNPKVQVILDTTGLPGTRAILEKLKHDTAVVYDACPESLLWLLLQLKHKLEEELKIGSDELQAAFNAMPEAVEVVDKAGIVKYVNSAFTAITGVNGAERLGKNIFEFAPYGALSQALVRQKPVLGFRYKEDGFAAEVVVNASPVTVGGEIAGAVALFQPISALQKLGESPSSMKDIVNQDSLWAVQKTFADIIGEDASLQEALDLARKVSATSSSVLITGESGTGKEMFAQAIHYASDRRNELLVKVDCDSVPVEILEEELFGTVGDTENPGKVELAHEGTLFLREISAMPLYLQGKLLRFLQEGFFERAGCRERVKADVRVIAAASCDLPRLVKRNKFREELFLRLNVVELSLPPLRARSKDIPALTAHLLHKVGRRLGKKVQNVSPEALDLLSNYRWTGNIRELESVLERSMIAAEGGIIEKKHMPSYLTDKSASQEMIPLEIMALDKMEEIMLKAALERYGNTLDGKKKAAKVLNISLATLYNKLRKYSNTL